MLTAERLREVLRYDPEMGIFVWLDHPQLTPQRRARYVGKRAGSKSGNDYRYIGVDGQIYCEHRLAWLYVTDEWPKDQVDHINCVRGDNRFSNLREATNGENMQNTGMKKNNTSGFKGVAWDARNKKFMAQIGMNGKLVWLGRFDDPRDAAEVYNAAAGKLHGEFARMNA